MSWNDLPVELAQQQRGVTVDLTDLFSEFSVLVQREANTAVVLAAIETRARVGVFQAAELAGRIQYGELRSSVRPPASLVTFAEQLAKVRANFVRVRAETVLSKISPALVSPYARLAAQVLVTDAARTGTNAGGLEGGATHKRFVRIRGAKEPRTHSKYEGTVRPIDGTWLIAGIEVDGPGDERLPWSEKAWCGHICRYFRQ